METKYEVHGGRPGYGYSVVARVNSHNPDSWLRYVVAGPYTTKAQAELKARALEQGR